jgi:hypothetical protein
VGQVRRVHGLSPGRELSGRSLRGRQTLHGRGQRHRGSTRRGNDGSSTDYDLVGGGKGLLRDCLLDQLARQRDVARERTVEIAFLEPGAEAYSFTFG